MKHEPLGFDEPKICYGNCKPDPPSTTVDPEKLEQKIRSRLGDLDTIPFVYRKLLSILNSPFVSARDLGKVISTDQSLSVRVLRMANSAYYGLTQKVVTVTHAINMLGLNVVRSLCFCLASYDSFFTGTGSEQARLWRLSMGTGLTAKNLARLTGASHPEELFVAGMMHDIGNAVLRKFAPREHAALLEKIENSEEPLEVEREFLGLERAEIGAFTCEAWKLPQLLVSCVRNLNRPEEAGEYRQATTLVAVAKQGWSNFELSTADWNPEHMEFLKLEPEEVMEAVKLAEAEFLELGSYVGLDAKAS